MADANDQMTGAAADDPDWIKSLVAEALLRASDDEPNEAVQAPEAPQPTPAPSPQPISNERPPAAATPSPVPPAVPPTGLSAPDPVLRSVDPAARQPSAAPSAPSGPRPTDPAVVARTSPLVVGRMGTEPQDTLQPPALSSLTSPSSVPTTAIATDPPRTTEDSAAFAPALHSADASDPVMIEADATTEGFRSSDIRTVLEWLAVIVSALAVALLIKAFVLQAFWIPSESMETTVNKGDRILVNKVSYRLHEVRRGDLVVFKKLPGTPGDTEDLIKRAIALPGETIEVRADGRIYIWGAGETAEDALLLEEPYLDPQNEFLAGPSASDALSVDIWDERCANQPRTPGRCTLAEDQLFMMGDNRNSSSDSRFFGPITDDLIVGRAFLRIWPLGEISSL